MKMKTVSLLAGVAVPLILASTASGEFTGVYANFSPGDAAASVIFQHPLQAANFPEPPVRPLSVSMQVWDPLSVEDPELYVEPPKPEPRCQLLVCFADSAGGADAVTRAGLLFRSTVATHSVGRGLKDRVSSTGGGTRTPNLRFRSSIWGIAGDLKPHS